MGKKKMGFDSKSPLNHFCNRRRTPTAPELTSDGNPREIPSPYTSSNLTPTVQATSTVRYSTTSSTTQLRLYLYSLSLE